MVSDADIRPVGQPAPGKESASESFPHPVDSGNPTGTRLAAVAFPLIIFPEALRIDPKLPDR